MVFWEKIFFKKKMDEVKKNHIQSESVISDEWELVHPYIRAEESDVKLVSLISSAFAVDDSEKSKLILKKILKRNNEHELISIIASSIFAGDNADCQVHVKSIMRRK
ncbi:hypothetical protein [Enterococcus gallinarum]|uniref:hypothetical protein n=1 Tax=Enterococcus gallinarum TaxID=1353 RepID=UPI0018AA7B74|nr:hypothetical protein [Enterococcus gallinarum]